MIFLLAVLFFLLGLAIGAAIFIGIDVQEEITPDSDNGWFSRPIKHFKCGAFQGHHWAQGIDHKRCTRCGKIKRCPHDPGEEVKQDD